MRWGKPIPGVPGYTVTARGAVYSHLRGRPRRLRVCPHHHGHERVQLRIDGRPRSFFVHVLVALVWIGPPPFEGACVLHRDGRSSNNRVANLRWGTMRENLADMREHGTLLIGERATSAKLTAELVVEARARKSAGVPTRALARDLGVHPSTMARALDGRAWGHVTEVGSTE